MSSSSLSIGSPSSKPKNSNESKQGISSTSLQRSYETEKKNIR